MFHFHKKKLLPRAIKIGLFKNGDPWFGPVNYHYLPGRDISRYISHLNLPAKNCSSIKKFREFFQFWSFAGWNYSKNGFYQWSIVYIWFGRQKNNWLRSNPWWRYKYLYCKKEIKLFSSEFLGIYVCSSSKKFVPGNYGSYGDGFRVDQDPDHIPNPKNDGLIR